MSAVFYNSNYYLHASPWQFINFSHDLNVYIQELFISLTWCVRMIDSGKWMGSSHKSDANMAIQKTTRRTTGIIGKQTAGMLKRLSKDWNREKSDKTYKTSLWWYWIKYLSDGMMFAGMIGYNLSNELLQYHNFSKVYGHLQPRQCQATIGSPAKMASHRQADGGPLLDVYRERPP